MLSRVKIGCVCITSLVVLGIRYCWFSSRSAQDWVMYGAYWFFCVLALTGIVMVVRSWDGWGAAWLYVKRERLWIGVAIFSSILLQLHEPHMLKINYDEHVLLGISRSMHYEHITAWPGAAMKCSGAIVPTALVVDKRPGFFPFLLSVLHSVSGYRPGNVFVLNWGVSVFLFLGLYHWGRIHGGHWGGGLLCALMATLPLLAQNATGGGYDLLNLALIVFLLCRLGKYIAEPSGGDLVKLVYVAIVLANTRYESLLYGVVPFLAFLYAWFDCRKAPEVPWILVLAPIGFLWPLLSNSVFFSQPSFFQAKADDFINISHLSHNIPYAVYYLFGFSRGGTNSVWLASFGVVLGVVGVVLVKRWVQARRQPDPQVMALFIIGSIIAVNTFVVLMLSWGEWNDPAVSRFSLPFWLILAIVVIAVLRGLSIQPKWWRVFALSSLGIVVLFALPDASQSTATHKLKGSWGIDWSLEFLRRYDPERNMLIVATSSIPYINNGYAAIPLERPLLKAFEFESTLRFGLYQGIVLVTEQRRSREDGTWLNDPRSQALLSKVNSSVVGEMVLDPFYRMQIIRIEGVVNNDARITWPKYDPNESADSYMGRVYKLMPSL